MPSPTLAEDPPWGAALVLQRIRLALGRETVSMASLAKDVEQVLDVARPWNRPEDRLLGAELARQAGGRTMARASLEAIVAGCIAHARKRDGGSHWARAALAQVSSFLRAVNDATRPAGEIDDDAVPDAFHAVVVAGLLRTARKDGFADVEGLRAWCEGTLERGYLREFAGVLKAALAAPSLATPQGGPAAAAATPQELALRLVAVMEGVERTVHYGGYLHCAHAYIDKAAAFDASTRAALHAAIAPAPDLLDTFGAQPPSDGKTVGSGAPPTASPRRMQAATREDMEASVRIMTPRLWPRDDLPLEPGVAAQLIAKWRAQFPQPFTMPPFVTAVVRLIGDIGGPAAAKAIGAGLVRQVSGSGLSVPQRDAFIRAVLQARVDSPVPMAVSRGYILGMDEAARRGAPANPVALNTQVIRVILSRPADTAATTGPARDRVDLEWLQDWCSDFAGRYPAREFGHLLAVAIPAAGRADATMSSSSSTTTTSPASAAEIALPPEELAMRLGAMLGGLRGDTLEAEVRKVAQAYVARAGFDKPCRVALDAVVAGGSPKKAARAVEVERTGNA